MTKKQHTTMDYLVLILVLALLAGAFLRFHALGKLPEAAPFTYQMELIEPEPGTAGTIAPGDTVICLSGKQPVGVVTGVLQENGRVTITLRAEGFPIEGGFRTNVYDILPGLEDQFYTESVRWYGVVTAVNEVCL